MEAITCGNFFILGIWMVFISYSFGQLSNREELVHYKQSSLNMQRFRLSKYPEVDVSRKAKISGQVVKKRNKRFASFSFSDPRWIKQRYLFENNGTGNFKAYHNVASVWGKEYTGKNVIVAIVDDGLKHTHDDLKGRYREDLSYDYVDNDPDPAPASSDGHGTKCAGVIAAAADNKLCGVGVAYNASIAGIRLTAAGLPSDQDAAKAFYPFPGHEIDIFSNSWGPLDSGVAIDGPGPLTLLALQNGTSKGRGGRGSIYVFSAGNGADFRNDNCAFNGFVNNIYAIPVAAVDEDAKPDSSSESCSAIMTSAYSSNLETTSVASNTACDSKFGATSGAAALVSGIIALALQARNTLTWRDVQHLIVNSSRHDIIDPSVKWTVNQAGYHVSNRVGFGFLDASLLIKNVENLNSTVPPQRKCEIVPTRESLWDNFETISFEIEVNQSQCGGAVINHLEHVVAIFDLKYFRRGVLGAYVTSPGGTKSQVLSSRFIDAIYPNRTRYNNLKTVSVHFWGEQPNGTWTISLRNERDDLGRGNGTLFGFSLTLYGTDLAWIPPKPIFTTKKPATTSEATTRPTTPSSPHCDTECIIIIIVVISCIILIVKSYVLTVIYRPSCCPECCLPFWCPSCCLSSCPKLCPACCIDSADPAESNVPSGSGFMMQKKATASTISSQSFMV